MNSECLDKINFKQTNKFTVQIFCIFPEINKQQHYESSRFLECLWGSVIVIPFFVENGILPVRRHIRHSRMDFNRRRAQGSQGRMRTFLYSSLISSLYTII